MADRLPVADERGERGEEYDVLRFDARVALPEAQERFARAEAALASRDAEIERLREALRYLADEESWTSGAKVGRLLALWALAPWKLARAALASTSDEEA